MPVVTKEFTFDAAHQLPGHNGKCARLHGHTYRLIVAVDAPVIPDDGWSSSGGMVIDFADLKRIVNEHVVNKLDHTFISSGSEPIVAVADAARKQHDDPAYQFPFGPDGLFIVGKRTTAENIAQWIYDTLLPYLPGLSYIELYETPTSMVRVGR